MKDDPKPQPMLNALIRGTFGEEYLGQKPATPSQTPASAMGGANASESGAILDLLVKCQHGEMTCMRALEIIERDTISMSWVREQHAAIISLCYAIEALPASEQQTALSIKASAISQEMQRVVNFVYAKTDAPPLTGSEQGTGEATQDYLECPACHAPIKKVGEHFVGGLPHCTDEERELGRLAFLARATPASGAPLAAEAAGDWQKVEYAFDKARFSQVGWRDVAFTMRDFARALETEAEGLRELLREVQHLTAPFYLPTQTRLRITAALRHTQEKKL